jgi:hypothetical protein
MVIASPTLLWLLRWRRLWFLTNKIGKLLWFYKITYRANFPNLKLLLAYSFFILGFFPPFSFLPSLSSRQALSLALIH